MNTDLVRETLRARADRAPTGAGLLDAVLARSRQRRQRQRYAGAGAVAVVVALAVAGPVVWLGRPAAGPADPANPAASGHTPTTPAPRTTVGEWTGAATLAPAPDFDLPAFPFTPTWSPPGLIGPAYVYHDFNVTSDVPQAGTSDVPQAGPGTSVALHYYDPDGVLVHAVEVRQNDVSLILDRALAQSDEIDVDESGDRPEPMTDQSVAVLGRPARLVSNSTTGVLGWQHGPTQWVVVWGSPDGGPDSVLRFAEGLAEEPFQPRLPFTLDRAPAGASLSVSEPDRMEFAPLAVAPGEQPGVAGVNLLRGGPGMPVSCSYSLEFDHSQLADVEDCPLPREPVRVGDHQAELVGSETVLVYLEDGLALQVYAIGNLSLSREDLLRFAAGIQLTEHAEPTNS